MGSAFAASAGLAACGGGGGGSTQPPIALASPTPTPTVAPTSTPAGTTLAGSVTLIPNDGFGPVTILGNAYGFDATGVPLGGATVIVGPLPIVGATPPAALPAGDVATTTAANGSFSLTIAAAPHAPSAAEPFVIPTNNITQFAPPAAGYYVQVFGATTDGVSAGAPLPLHAFRAATSFLALHVTSASSAEAGALAAVNADRASNAGAPPLIFDEAAEEAARLHAYDESQRGYYCHYDTFNVGPSSRYLQVGGLGLTGEGLGLPGSGVTSSQQAFADFEAEVLSEKSSSGGHYTNLVDSAHAWAGVGSVIDNSIGGGGFFAVDYELITPSNLDLIVGSSGYPVTSGPPGATCPSNIVDNNS